MSTAAKLLSERSYREISVLDIVSESKVNRNTFYYHFRDMPALVEELAKCAVDRVMDQPGQSALGCISRLLELVCSNKKAVLHVYSSADRILFDRGLDNVCAYFTERFADKYMHESCPENRELHCRIKKDCCYGIMSDWLSEGLRREDLPMLTAMCEMTLRLLK